MNSFHVWHMRHVKQVLIVAVAALFAAGFLYFENILQLPVFSAGGEPKAIYHGEGKGNKVALTFDISWGDTKAVPILDALKENDIKNATFFLSASWAERHPKIVERIQKEGHHIGSMGYAYKNYSGMEPEQVSHDLQLAQTVFKQLNIKNVTLLRPPTGNFNKQVLKIADRFGLTVVHYSIDTKDWTNPGVTEIVKAASDARSGDIILLHASDSAKQTAAAIPAIAGYLKNQRLENAGVSDLISNADAKSEEVK
ncbi:polysaccharide deacetylase family protein [Metabacillus sp. GX 13764]|uniref:polysaccharide deacetylase family protein n=1 Tax=Metabacillus kandeliae TaxID=2900151 RepID=UPI001E433552|nr:polysaccharide deacetylase family protein [Metabacillus kandeliae]MCD7036619.1 polysaccharide deacetylase family protein [Metabacillus kandeliae]